MTGTEQPPQAPPGCRGVAAQSGYDGKWTPMGYLVDLTVPRTHPRRAIGKSRYGLPLTASSFSWYLGVSYEDGCLDGCRLPAC